MPPPSASFAVPFSVPSTGPPLQGNMALAMGVGPLTAALSSLADDSSAEPNPFELELEEAWDRSRTQSQSQSQSQSAGANGRWANWTPGPWTPGPWTPGWTPGGPLGPLGPLVLPPPTPSPRILAGGGGGSEFPWGFPSASKANAAEASLALPAINPSVAIQPTLTSSAANRSIPLFNNPATNPTSALPRRSSMTLTTSAAAAASIAAPDRRASVDFLSAASVARSADLRVPRTGSGVLGYAQSPYAPATTTTTTTNNGRSELAAALTRALSGNISGPTTTTAQQAQGGLSTALATNLAIARAVSESIAAHPSGNPVLDAQASLEVQRAVSRMLEAGVGGAIEPIREVKKAAGPALDGLLPYTGGHGVQGGMGGQGGGGGIVGGGFPSTCEFQFQPQPRFGGGGQPAPAGFQAPLFQGQQFYDTQYFSGYTGGYGQETDRLTPLVQAAAAADYFGGSSSAAAPQPQTVSSNLNHPSTNNTKNEEEQEYDDRSDDEDAGRKRRKVGGGKAKGTAENPERRKEFLERNRVAASKCRQKKKAYLTDLQTSYEETLTANAALESEIASLGAEIERVRGVLGLCGGGGCRLRG